MLLSYLMPDAAVILLDANGAMEMGHVARRAALRFVQLDLHAADAVGAITDAVAATRPRLTIAIGVHLCGALCPRLIDLALRLPLVGSQSPRSAPPPVRVPRGVHRR